MPSSEKRSETKIVVCYYVADNASSRSCYSSFKIEIILNVNCLFAASFSLFPYLFTCLMMLQESCILDDLKVVALLLFLSSSLMGGGGAFFFANANGNKNYQKLFTFCKKGGCLRISLLWLHFTDCICARALFHSYFMLFS